MDLTKISLAILGALLLPILLPLQIFFGIFLWSADKALS